MPALITWWTRDVATLHPGAAPEQVYAAGTSLLARWTEAHRHYHGTQHLVEMFWALEELDGAGEIDERDGTLARIAGWLHDAIYDPNARPGVNERDSATLARTTLTELGLGPRDVDTVERLVQLTAGHEPDSSDPTPVERAFHDADLWILGADPARYDDYGDQVRAEYHHVSDAAYRFGRTAVLQGFARRPRIYRTGHAAEVWEPRARSNLDRELTRLSPPATEVR